MIEIVIRRDDGDIAHLKGASGMAVCAPPLNPSIVAQSEPAWVSLRCSTAAELAWNLAALLSAVQHHSPEAYDMAHELMAFVDFTRPAQMRRAPRLDTEKGEPDNDS